VIARVDLGKRGGDLWFSFDREAEPLGHQFRSLLERLTVGAVCRDSVLDVRPVLGP
jgi:hypothetical protein